MNEAAGLLAARHTNSLTQEQKREQEAAIYGLSSNQKRPMLDISQLTQEDIAQLRSLLNAGGDEAQGQVKEFDLNNPPKQPYVYQPFPRVVYHHAKGTHRKVHSQAEFEAALEAGWSKTPAPPAVVADVADEDASASNAAPEFDEPTAIEIAELDAIAKKKKK